MQQLIDLDETLAANFYQFVSAQPFLKPLFIFLGVYLVYLIPIIFIVVWFATSRKASLRAATTGVFAWFGLNKLIANLVDRPRPSMSDLGVKELVFHRPDHSFPSDHSAFLMAVAMSFYLSGHKKLSYTLFIITILVGIARVGIGVHFPADILFGWLIGIVTALLVEAIKQPLDRHVIEPLITLARKFKL